MTQIFTRATSWSPDGYLDVYISGRGWFILHGGLRPMSYAVQGVLTVGLEPHEAEDYAL